MQTAATAQELVDRPFPGWRVYRSTWGALIYLNAIREIESSSVAIPLKGIVKGEFDKFLTSMDFESRILKFGSSEIYAMQTA